MRSIAAALSVPRRSSARKRANALSAAGEPARTPRKFGNWPAAEDAPLRIGSDASGAVRSSWMGKRLICVLGIGTAGWIWGGGCERRPDRHLLQEVSLRRLPRARKHAERRAHEPGARRRDPSGFLVAGAEDRDQDQQHAEPDGVRDDPVR